MSNEWNIDEGPAPRLRSDFAARVLRQARLVQRQRQDRRRATLGMGLLAVLAVGGFTLVSSLGGRPRPEAPPVALLEAEESTLLTTDALFSTLDIFGDRIDDPAGLFFPDSDTMMASASD
jgi:hypothetical protein